MDKAYSCRLMVEVGIKDADSKEGIEFCGVCPFSDCMLFREGTGCREERDKEIKERWESMKTYREIAEEFGLTEKTIGKIIRRINEHNRSSVLFNC